MAELTAAEPPAKESHDETSGDGMSAGRTGELALHEVLFENEELVIERAPDVVMMRTRSPHDCVSYAPQGGGLRVTSLVANHAVVPEDLTLDVDPLRFLAERHRERVGPEGVAMMTACDVRLAHVAHAVESGERGEIAAVAVATVGLSNLLRAGDPPGALAPVDTINILVWVSAALSECARLEALTIATEARTLAVREAELPSRRSGHAGSGTGTDCIALMSRLPEALASGEPRPQKAAPWAGKHTAEGAVVGRAVHSAVAAGVARWRGIHGDRLERSMRAHFGSTR